MLAWNRKSISWVVVGAVLLSSVACARSGRVQDGDENLPPATQNLPELEATPLPLEATAAPTSEEAPQQPTAQAETPQPVTPTEVPPPSPMATLTPAESGPSDQAITQGEELESMLDELDRMNQSADSLEDVP